MFSYRNPGRPLMALMLALVTASPAAPQARPPLAPKPEAPQPRLLPTPKPEPVAETKLLMQGINMANFQGLERLLRQKPADTETWVFARGQALLIAENANLLMLRPPRSRGREAWLERAGDLRETATLLARAAANRDFERSRAALKDLAQSCNRCHAGFRVNVTITPFAPPPKEEKGTVP
jgi:hypothetical protein